jgi:hypothetical protein
VPRILQPLVVVLVSYETIVLLGLGLYMTGPFLFSWPIGKQIRMTRAIILDRETQIVGRWLVLPRGSAPVKDVQI